MKKLFTMTLSLAVLLVTACGSGERSIAMEELPEAARQFVEQHFDGMQVSHIIQDREITSKEYDVWFVSGDKVEFTKKGVWTKIDCKHSAVPVSVIPLEIVNNIAGSYPQAIVKQIEHEKHGYEVKLDNGMELKYNKEYRLVNIDD